MIEYHPTFLERVSAPVHSEELSESSETARLSDQLGKPSVHRKTLRYAGGVLMSFLKRLERNFTALFKLGRTEWMAKFAKREVDRLSEEVKVLQSQRVDLEHRLQKSAEVMAEVAQQAEKERIFQQASLAEARRTQSDFSRRLDMLLQNGAGLSVVEMKEEGGAFLQAEGFQAYLDSFYHQLENKFRGSREDIKNRMKVYLPEVEAALVRTKGKPVLDVGCGRGEFVELLSEAGISAFGVDTNLVQIQDDCLDIRVGDALQTLIGQPDESLSVITAHHLIEHLPFEKVAFMTREALRVLAPGGLLVFETPNPRNILVGASSFYNDPTHRNPVTESVLKVLFEATGFDPIKMWPLHPHERLGEFQKKPGFDLELAHILFGPQDLAALARKPLGQAENPHS